VIVDSISKEPIVGARLVLLDSTGTALAVTVTSTDGTFAFKLPHVGQYRVLVSRIGYPTITTKRFIVDSAFTARVSLTLPSTPLTLDTVAVVATGVEKRLQYLADAGFYHRLQVGFGHYLTRADIDKRDPLIMSDLLHDMPGVRVTCTGARRCSVTMRAANSMFMRGKCQPSVVLDGVLLRAGGVGSGGDLNLDDLINPFNVEALEVYPGPEGVPVQYSGYLSPCGAIIVWSRR
jgi:Carboxypeptidase regulatory-like domain/TonB-dependent Receptor Plug Domain